MSTKSSSRGSGARSIWLDKDARDCGVCYVRSLTTVPAGTKINGDTFTIPDTLGEKTFHPFNDFLLHNVGTGDGIVMAWEEHYGRIVYRHTWKNLSADEFQNTRNKVRTCTVVGFPASHKTDA